MGRVKLKRKSTLIDMTAMSDVTVLLLTFFMLTSTFLQKEPVTVITPSSVSEEKVSNTNVATILVDPQGHVFIGVTGEANVAPVDPRTGELPEGMYSQKWGSDSVRMAVLDYAVGKYNELHKGKEINITDADRLAFSKINMFGVPFSKLKEYLAASQIEQDDYVNPEKAAFLGGIPVDDNTDRSKPNELQIWLEALRHSGNDLLTERVKSGEGIAVKADKNTTYETVHTVLDNMQTMNMNRFTIMTALKTEED